MISTSASDTDNSSSTASQQKSVIISNVCEPDFKEQSSENEWQISRGISVISPLVRNILEVDSNQILLF